jgi:GT2 family glycosyltransferase
VKKYVVKIAKFCIGLFPRYLRDRIKKNARLTTFYTRMLRDVGIIQAIPSVKRQTMLYRKNLQFQSRSFNQLLATDGPVPILIICTNNLNKQSIFNTLTGVEALSTSFDSVLFYCTPAKELACRRLLKKMWACFHDENVITALDNDLVMKKGAQACFVIYEGDVLHPDCCRVLKAKILPGTTVAYTDSDRLDKKGERHSPEFYPDWNPDLLLSTGYIQSGVWFSSLELLANKPLSFNFSGLTEWIILNYLSADLGTIQHIPLVLLHRPEELPAIFSQFSDNTKIELALKAQIKNKLNDQVLSLDWKIDAQPLVSLIIPTKNSKFLVQACVESILKRSTYKNYEILLVDNNSDEQESILYFEHLAQDPRITVLEYPYEFNYSAINNFAAQHAKGEVLGLVNNDIEVIEADWLNYMVGHVMRNDIGCVGAKLLYGDERVQHAGVVMGYGGGAGHAHKYFPHDHPGYLNRLSATQNYSAVTAACLLVKKVDFEAVGGLNELDLKIAFNDVDFCLRILALGRRNLYCAEAVLYHHESVSRGLEDTIDKRQRFEREVSYLQKNWQAYIDHDPAYNPNLTLRQENFSIRE